ncbi:MAG: GWxTD domain-containing protein [Bacteroidales bacterium]|nr:GWxTD domain-containing protein [Bacteroidales bacterium]MDX9798825.1 GWxTD domain-containing protein [Bacteroidales bacterium]
MKRFSLLFIMSFLPLISFSTGINAIYSFSTYNIPSQKPYVEINTSIQAKSLEYKNNEARIEFTLVLLKDSQIVYVEKRELKVVKSSNDASVIDIQRVSLENGKYSARFELKDKNTPMEPMVIEDEFEINYPKNQIAVSSVQIIDSYKKTTTQNIRSKNGYDLTPYLFDAVPENKNILTYYSEIYNADKEFGKDSTYIISVNVESIKTGKKIESIQRVRREKAREISVEMGNLDITSLPQGGYYLVVEARSKNSILFSYSKLAFYRYSNIENDIQSAIPSDAFVNMIPKEEIDENILCLTPIASEAQKSFIYKHLKSASVDEKKHFLYMFWRGINPENPNLEWKSYMNEVRIVDDKFSTKIKKGYETEMGRVYLQYGKPDIVIDEKFKATSGMRQASVLNSNEHLTAEFSQDAISYMPYQIWKYHKTPYGEVNKGFVFYAPQNNLMEYLLLHSDAKGEPSDMFWESRLTRGNMPEGMQGEAGLQFKRGY